MKNSARHASNLPDAFVAETMAVQTTLGSWLVTATEGSRLTIFTDYKALVNTLEDGETYLCPSWRALELVARLRRTLEDEGDTITISHARRETVTSAHTLTNMAHRLGQSYEGRLTEKFCRPHHIQLELGGEYFQNL
jgi:Reverse transcriptase-like